jgi:hypothetical protein
MWGVDAEEVSFTDMINGTGRSKPGYDKIRFCGEQARCDGLQYFWIDTAASISQTAPSCRRLSTLCFAGTITRLHATCILPMSRDLPWAVIASPVSRPGNHLFGGANGLPGGGPFRSLLLLCWSNSSLKKANVWVIGDLWNDISTKQPEFPLKSFEAALCL